MHPNQLRTLQAAAEGLGFEGRQLLQALHRDLPAKALLTQHPIEPEVAGFTGQELAIEGLQLGIRAMDRQQGHALMAAGLD